MTGEALYLLLHVVYQLATATLHQDRLFPRKLLYTRLILAFEGLVILFNYGNVEEDVYSDQLRIFGKREGGCGVHFHL